MTISQSWAAYPPTYRAREMKILSNWIVSGESGSVVGLNGCGRANLLSFLCYRPEVLQTYLAPQIKRVALIPIDLNPVDGLKAIEDILRNVFRPDKQVQRRRFDIHFRLRGGALKTAGRRLAARL